MPRSRPKRWWRRPHRCGTAPPRKVEVSNPHGRAVYLFSKQGAPANEAYLPGRRGSGSNAGEVALGHRLASEHLSSRSTLQCKSARILRPTAPPARFERASSGVGDRCASSRATGAVGPRSVQSHHPEPTRGPQPYRGCALLLSYGGVASSTGLEPVASAFAGQRSCPSELRRDGTPARTRTRNWRFVVSCDYPFHHQGLAPQTGFDPVASAVTRRRSPD